MPEADSPGALMIAYLDRVAGGPPRESFSPRRGGVLEQVRIYAADGPAHWHVVTVGVGDLGFELTIRLPRTDDHLPTWAVDFVTSLVRYSRRGAHPFAVGHHIDLRGPMKLDAKSLITAAALSLDPTLGPVSQVEFLQIVGLTADELELCRSWRTSAVVDLVGRGNPLLITDLDRVSRLDDPALRTEAEAGVAADGSALDELRVGTLRWRRHGVRRTRLVVTMGAGAATALGPALRRMLSHEGASFVVSGDEGVVRFSVASDVGWRLEGGELSVRLALADVDGLAGLFTGRTGTGSLPALPGLRFAVVA